MPGRNLINRPSLIAPGTPGGRSRSTDGSRWAQGRPRASIPRSRDRRFPPPSPPPPSHTVTDTGKGSWCATVGPSARGHTQCSIPQRCFGPPRPICARSIHPCSTAPPSIPAHAAPARPLGGGGKGDVGRAQHHFTRTGARQGKGQLSQILLRFPGITAISLSRPRLPKRSAVTSEAAAHEIKAAGDAEVNAAKGQQTAPS